MAVNYERSMINEVQLGMNDGSVMRPTQDRGGRPNVATKLRRQNLNPLVYGNKLSDMDHNWLEESSPDGSDVLPL